MREFKFRILEKANKKLYFYSLDEIFKTDFFKTHDFKEFEISQYTGLKDCKGREIYEGDIVKFWVDGYAKSRTAKVKFNTERGRWILFATIGHHIDLTAEKASKCEIIGNIYENKELLK